MAEVVFIYNSPSNSLIRRELDGIEAGMVPVDIIMAMPEIYPEYYEAISNGQVKPYVEPVEMVMSRERAWRDEEIKWADYEINKARDSEYLGYTVTDYPLRELTLYRQALRDYPQIDDFPACDRPVRPESNNPHLGE